MKKNNLTVLLIAFMLMTSCNRDEVQAKESLEGEWVVSEIYSTYGEYSVNGFSSSNTVSETGVLGNFNFLAETVEYSFTRNDTTYSGNELWNLEFERVNSGFTKTNKFTLNIGTEFIFDVSFEDETKNAEKNAKNATFKQDPDFDNEVMVVLMLNKR
jgi:hypothetical protein